MHILRLALDSLPVSKSRDKLIVTRKESLDGWHWNENTEEYEWSDLPTMAYEDRKSVV